MAGAADQQAGHANDGEEWRVTMPAAGVAAPAVEHENAKGASRHDAKWLCCTPAWPCLFSWVATPAYAVAGVAGAAWLWLSSCAASARDRVAGFGRMVWKVGADDPRRAVHGFKMALALSLCSVFYYVRPLYDFTGESAMWAVLTVVVVFEYTVGGCFYKGLNRTMATVIGGALALGVQWIASKSGKEVEPFILTGALFLFAAVATYSRFIPTMKARFDYGVTVFILTYTLVSVSGYRAEEVVFMAQHRLSTIAIGAFICFAVCALIFPVWAGQELHAQVARNMDKLAAAVEGCVEDYFSEAIGADAGAAERPARRALSAKSQGYRAVLNAKASEDSMANLARWEPAHGKFGFRHPYPLYQKVGAAMRCCAYCVDALAAGVASEAQAPPHVKKHLAGVCVALGRHCAAVLREASGSVASMTRSGRLAVVVGDMSTAAQELRDELRCLAAALEDDESSDTEHEQSNATVPPAVPLIEALPLFTAASLLLEICTRAEGVVGAVDVLATTAKFKKADDDEGSTLDVEACAPVAMSTNLTADAPQETHAKVAGDKEKAEAAADHGTENAPRDQVGELIKVLMRRRSTKKWARGEAKVCPKPPLDFVVHAPSPKSRSMELTGSAQVVPSPRSWSVELGGYPPVAPSPRHRSVDFANHGPAVPSPRNRSMDFANHGPVVPSPRNRSILGKGLNHVAPLAS
ncbi:hypothetical protein ACP70R_044373 [Stipagrostis hirtigluma subsp. patula]